ncbi:uncharacterized protein LOC111035702 [Myzus persicae]|uniref:uncharacterized protein LOC111035702 n=1 Tax=Myzus persicae TaxID=13164 RepID=UPI000B93426C|nr:uncharacterized protein LOC111035702 [Myzus persicae]XP_022173119.1 uncharacterized protein LOC111035702 [Myzus persicae]
MSISSLNLVDQFDASLNIHTKLKDIIDPGVVSSKECSKANSRVHQSITSPILSVSVNPFHLVQEEISEILSTSTPDTGILLPVACPVIEILTTSNLFLFEFPRPYTIISSMPTELRLVSCIPYNIMSPCVQPRIDARNILRTTTFMYGSHLFPIIEHLKYTMKIFYNENNQTPTIYVMKITCGTQVTQSFKLKCVEKVSVTKQQNGSGINSYYHYQNLNNNVINETNITQKYQTSANHQTTMTNF